MTWQYLDRTSYSKLPSTVSPKSKGKGKAKEVVEKELEGETNEGVAPSSADEGEDEVVSEEEDPADDGAAASKK